MISRETKVNVADNTGAKVALIIGARGSTKKSFGYTDIVNVAIKSIKNTKNSKVKKGEVHLAIIVRLKKNIQKKDGLSFSFGDNAVVLVSKSMSLMGTSITGAVSSEIMGLGAIGKSALSLASEVI